MKDKIIKIVAGAICAAFGVTAVCVTVPAIKEAAGYCQHKFETVEAVEATCLKVGKKTAYRCTNCGKLFSYGYVNGTDGKKDAIEIPAQEVSGLGGHVVSSFFGDINAKATSLDATSLEDYSVWSTCAEEGCGMAFEVEPQNLIAFAPAVNNGNPAKHVVEGNGMDATKFTIPAGTGAGKCYTITTGDTGMQNATHKIPFAASQPRYVVLFLRNDGNVDVTVRYGVEVSGYRSQHTPTVVPAHGYETLSFTINDPVHTQADSWHELYIDTDIEETFDLTISGYYYNETKLQNIKISKNPEKVEYAIGETFDATGMVVTADYGNNVTRKLGADEFSVLIGSKNKPATEPLTEEDTEVYVIHQNKMAKLAIRVQHFEQTVALNGASFADGASSKVLDRNAVLPADIVTAQGKTLKHFIDQYNKTYIPGEGKVAQYDMVLTPVYEGEVKSENYAANASFTSTQTKHGGTCSALNNGLTCLNTLDHDRWGTIEFETAEGTNGEQPWLIADLGDVKSINQVVLYPRLGGSSSSPKAEYFPEAYKIYVSEDNATWTEVYFEDYDKYAGLNEVIARYNNFASVNARYVKVVGTKLSNDGAGYIFQLSEIEIFGNVQAA